jgi:hypothetical protein
VSALQRFRRLRIGGLPVVALANICHYRGPGEYLALFCDPGDGQLMLVDGVLGYTVQPGVVIDTCNNQRFLAGWAADGFRRPVYLAARSSIALGGPSHVEHLPR